MSSVCKVTHVKLQIKLYSLLHPVYRHPLAKCASICQQGGPGAPGLKGDSGDPGPSVRTLSYPRDQATSISLRLRKRLCSFIRIFFSSKGPRGLQGTTGPPGKSGKRVIVVVFFSCF